jgi:hypothetical protein
VLDDLLLLLLLFLPDGPGEEGGAGRQLGLGSIDLHKTVLFFFYVTLPHIHQNAKLCFSSMFLCLT